MRETILNLITAGLLASGLVVLALMYFDLW